LIASSNSRLWAIRASRSCKFTRQSRGGFRGAKACCCPRGLKQKRQFKCQRSIRLEKLS
jgi:hypothetical protein